MAVILLIDQYSPAENLFCYLNQNYDQVYKNM